MVLRRPKKEETDDRKDKSTNRWNATLADSFGCEELYKEASKPPLEPYGENADPQTRDGKKKSSSGGGDDDDEAEFAPLCSPIGEQEDFPQESGTQRCLVSSITRHEAVIAASRSMALVFMTLVALCACAVMAAGVVCLMQYRFNLALSIVEIMVALAMFIIAACGFYSAWSEQPTYLRWSVGAMLSLAVAVLVVGVGMIQQRHRLESEGFEADFKARAKAAYVDGSETNRAYIDAIQETLQCCGANDGLEYYYLQGHFGAPAILAKETVRRIGNIVRQEAAKKAKPALHVQVKSAKGGKASLQAGGKLRINIENAAGGGDSRSSLAPAPLPVSPDTGLASQILPCTCCVDVSVHEHCGDLGIGKCSRVHTRGCKGAMLSSMGMTTLVAGSLAIIAGVLGLAGAIACGVLASHLSELHADRLNMLSSHCMAPT